MKSGTILSNVDIKDICNILKIPLVGVFSKDKLPKKKYKGLFVVNLDDYANGGTHWTIMSTLDDNVCYYDSYGANPPVSVDNYIKWVTGKKKYFINQIQVQSLNSTYCGWFCVCVLYVILNKRGSIRKKIDVFNDHFNSDDLNSNYQKLLAFFQKLIK